MVNRVYSDSPPSMYWEDPFLEQVCGTCDAWNCVAAAMMHENVLNTAINSKKPACNYWYWFHSIRRLYTFIFLASCCLSFMLFHAILPLQSGFMLFQNTHPEEWREHVKVVHYKHLNHWESTYENGSLIFHSAGNALNWICIQ